MTNHEAYTDLDVTGMLDTLDDRVEADRDWSPVPAEYADMSVMDVSALISDFEAEQEDAEEFWSDFRRAYYM